MDVLSVILIKSIIPNILLKRTLKKRLENQLIERRQNYTFSPTNQLQLESHYKQIAYYTPDNKRDEAAKRICGEKKIVHVEYNYSSLYLHVLSDKLTQFEPKIYIVQLLPRIQCQCMDFLSRGGACKHLRASVIWINWLRLQSSQLQYYQSLDHQSLPYILLPSKDDAIKEAKDNQNEVIFSEIKDQDIKEEETNNNYTQNNTGIKIDNVL